MMAVVDDYPVGDIGVEFVNLDIVDITLSITRAWPVSTS